MAFPCSDDSGTMPRIEPYEIERFRLPSVDPEQMAQLAQYLLRLRKTDPGVVRTNRGGWHSSNIQDDPALAPFITGILATARKLTETPGLEALLAWANVNEQGDFMIPHRHGGVVRVAALMVQPVPLGAKDEGALIVEDRLGRMIAVDPFPEAGEVVMFPGDVLHTVTPHRQSAPRITVAFNLCTTK